MFGRHHSIKRVLATLSGLLLGLGPAAALADTIYVCWDGSGDYLTIQEGIDAASDGDEVVVCDGVYTGAGNKNLDFGGRAITVRSENGPENCIIDCGGTGQGFWFHNQETHASVVQGLTITRADWGGIECAYGSTPTISNCTIVDNTGGSGGGVLCYVDLNGSPRITDCVIIGNTAEYGGGIYCQESSPTITDCVIIGNTAEYDGGGIGCYYSSPTISNCTIAGNSTDGGDGGGLYCERASPTIADCTISGNTAHYYGGGVYCYFRSNPVLINCAITGNVGMIGGMACVVVSSPRIINCVVAGNTASGIVCFGGSPTIANSAITGNAWGGIACHSARASIVSSTIAGNTYDEPGGGVYCAGSSGPTISNCILWNNTPQEICVLSDQCQPVVRYCDVRGAWPGWGNIDADPLFEDPDGPDDDPNTWEDNDYRLGGGSPCIDAGCNGAVPPDVADLDDDGDTSETTPLDLDGDGRFFDDPDTDDTGCRCPPIVDMGAYEFGDTGSQPCPGDLDCDRVVGHSDLGIILSAWQRTDEGDLNCDGLTNHSDLGILLGHWGAVCP